MVKYNIFQKLFSITNVNGHKQICLFGVKLKFIRKYHNRHRYENLPIQQNKIIFKSCLRGYNCNPKYITEEIIKRKLPYDLVWVVSADMDKTSFPNEVRFVEENSNECLKEYATSKIWIANERIKTCTKKGLYKREGQYYINTWHGSFGGKKCTADRGTLSHAIMLPYQIEAKQIDFLFSNSTYETEFLKRMFWGNGQVFEIGHARNDIFFNKEEQKKIKKKIYSYYKIPIKTKNVLYAPTFRDDKDVTCYTLDYQKLKNALTKRFGSEWNILVRLHPQLSKIKKQFVFDKCTIDVTDYPDMQELLVSTDILVTDYSSCIFDFMLLERPAFIFATDLEKYNNTRGLYDTLTSTPFLVATNNDSLEENILKFDNYKYSYEIKHFLEKKGSIEDGNASKRAVDIIQNIIENK